MKTTFLQLSFRRSRLTPTNTMKTTFLLPIVAALAAATSVHAVVTIDYVMVGDVGNAADPSTGGTYGAVAYGYKIGKYEVTNAQYAEFLNNADPDGTNPNGIYDANMGSNVRGGISFSAGNASGSKYAVKADMGDKPVNWVSFTDAMRFTNWIHNGQGAATTESGAYDMSVAASTVAHASNASVWLPTEDEWYKAAYYQSTIAGGDTDSYWLYPTQSNTVPTMATAGFTGDISNPGANVANYDTGADWNAQNGNVTTVGSAGLTSDSYYGAYDLGGNVWEWNEAFITGERGLRGGSFFSSVTDMESILRNSYDPTSSADNVGFRLATSVPEPSRMMLFALGLSAAMLRRRRSGGIHHGHRP